MSQTTYLALLTVTLTALACHALSLGRLESPSEPSPETPQEIFAESLGYNLHDFRCDGGDCVLLVYGLNWYDSIPIYATCDENVCSVAIPGN